MTMRLARVLSKIIDPAQSAFVEGRLMSDNIFLVQELLKKYLFTRETKRCFLNIDLAKAYDTISWSFLRFALDHLGVPHIFSSWIMECVQTASYSIKVNKSLFGHFQGKRGLRQGDPLSPLLFVICMEVLTRLIKKDTSSREFSYHQFCESTRLTHLMFADDIVLFCKGEIKSIKVLLGCLTKFQGMSGLSVNLAKSSIFLGSVPLSEKAALIA